LPRALFGLLESIGGLSEDSETLLAKTVAIVAFLVDAAPDRMRESFEDEPGFELVLKLAANAEVEPELLEQVIAFAGIKPEERRPLSHLTCVEAVAQSRPYRAHRNTF
jgi:hypothetical protein